MVIEAVIKRENAVQDYVDYLKRHTRCSPLTLYEAHQHSLCREVAKEYGVTQEQLLELDTTLKSTD